MTSKKAKTNRFPYDVKVLFPVLLLLGIGLAMLYSASSAISRQVYGTDYFYLQRQALFAVLGICVLMAGRYFPYRWYQSLTYPLLGLAIALLLAVLLMGVKAGGATRWLSIAGLTFQPSEFARLAVVIYLAYSLTKKQNQLSSFKIGFLPHVAVLFVFAVLILMEPDFGSAVILFTIGWIMMFAGGVRLTHLLIPLIAIIPAGIFVMLTEPYRFDRIMAFRDPWKYAADEGYQIVHSQMAFGTGGIFGNGIGNGYQKLFFLPEPHTDFIFSVIGEELGLMGVLAILTLYAILVFRGLSIARTSKDTFAAVLAVGMTSAIGIQVIINIGVALGLLPPKGLPLPFLSYGGTSLLVSMAAAGILMNIDASNPVKRTRSRIRARKAK